MDNLRLCKECEHAKPHEEFIRKACKLTDTCKECNKLIDSWHGRGQARKPGFLKRTIRMKKQHKRGV